MFKGITAQYLLKSTYRVAPGAVVLLYGVAGALGHIMVPWAKHLGAFVIGIVSKQRSVKPARALGCDAVLVWGADDVPAKVSALTSGKKADVVYDGVGRATWEASLSSLRPRGLLASIGASSGPPPPIDVGTLNAKGSLFLTRPSLAAYSTDVAEYRGRAEDVLATVAACIIKPSVWKTYALADAAEAHAALEGGTSAGAIVLKPQRKRQSDARACRSCRCALLLPPDAIVVGLILRVLPRHCSDQGAGWTRMLTTEH